MRFHTMTTAKVAQWASIRGYCHAKVVIQVKTQDNSGHIPVDSYSMWLESALSPRDKAQAQEFNELAVRFVDGFNRQDVIPALKACVAELQRLRDVHLPRYEGKIGEPNMEVLALAKLALI